MTFASALLTTVLGAAAWLTTSAPLEMLTVAAAVTTLLLVVASLTGPHLVVRRTDSVEH